MRDSLFRLRSTIIAFAFVIATVQVVWAAEVHLVCTQTSELLNGVSGTCNAYCVSQLLIDLEHRRVQYGGFPWATAQVSDTTIQWQEPDSTVPGQGTYSNHYYRLDRYSATLYVNMDTPWGRSESESHCVRVQRQV